MSMNLSLGQRIGIAFFVLLSLVVVAGAVGLLLVAELRGAVDDISFSVAHINQSQELEEAWRDYTDRVDPSLRVRRAVPSEPIALALGRFERRLSTLQFEEVTIADSRSEAHADVSAALAESGRRLYLSGLALNAALGAGQWDQAAALRQEQFTTQEPAFARSLALFRRDEHREVAEAIEASRAAEARVTLFWQTAAIVLVLTAVFSAIAVTRSTLSPIRSLTEQARRVTNRDFSPLETLARKDDIGELSRAFARMTDWLRDSYVLLEQRVDESTRDLELAAEVSQAISRMQDLQSMLDDAVELIRHRFDLYYTQIYLADESGLSLSLKAGSGLAGAELTRAGHQLTIGPGSVVGLAAMRRAPIVVEDTSQSDIFRPNAVLPHTRSELAVPLLVGDQVAAVLNLHASQVGRLSEERLPAFAAIAGQLAIAIQNARLFTEVESARLQLARQAQRAAHEGWQAYLDGIDRSQHLVAAYDGQVTRMALDAPPVARGAAVVAPITISGAEIGRIQVALGERGTTPADARALVAAVADQVARRVESIRLLEQANRFRQEAEASSRRLTHDAWLSYLRGQEGTAAGYTFESNTVRPLAPEENVPPDALVAPLQVRDQAIGVLAASGLRAEDGPFARELLTGIASRLASHLENLRLSHATEHALAESQRRNQELALVNQVVAAATSSLDLQKNLSTIVVELVGALDIGHAGIALLNEEKTHLTVVADASSRPDDPSAVGTIFPLEGNALTQQVMETRQIVVVRDAPTNPRLAPVRETLRRRRTETLVLCPVMAGNEVIGTLGLDIVDARRQLGGDELRLVDTVMRQAATAIQQSRLFHHLQTTLARTEALYEGSSRIIQSRSPGQVLAAVVESTILREMNDVNILLFDRPWSDQLPDTVAVVANWRRDADQMEPERPRPAVDLERLPTLRQMAPGRPYLVRDLDKEGAETGDLRYLAAGSDRVRGLAMFPVIVRGQWLGILAAQSASPLALRDEDVRQIGNLTGQGATVIENLRLLEKTESALAETAVLFHMSGALNAASSLEEMLRAVATASITPGVEVVELLLLEPDRDGEVPRVRLASRWLADGRHAEPLFAGREQWETTAVPGQTVFRDDPYSALLIDDCGDDARLDDAQRRRYAAAGIRATAILPLRQGQQWLGYLVLGWPEPCTFSAREWRLYSGFANQAAITLANLRLLGQTQAQARRERILREVTERVRNASDVDTIMRIAAQEIGQALGRPTVVSLDNGAAPEAAVNGDGQHE